MEALNAFRSSCSPSRESFYTSTEAAEFFLSFFLSFQEVCSYFSHNCALLKPRSRHAFTYSCWFSLSLIDSVCSQFIRFLYAQLCAEKSLRNVAVLETPANDFYTTLEDCLASLKSSLETLIFHFA